MTPHGGVAECTARWHVATIPRHCLSAPNLRQHQTRRLEVDMKPELVFVIEIQSWRTDYKQEVIDLAIECEHALLGRVKL